MPGLWVLADSDRLRERMPRALVRALRARGLEPRVAPVDGLFYRARFWFGSAHDSARFRHLRARPAVSAAHTRGEELAVIVHGTAVETSLAGHPFRDYCYEVYGDAWDDFGPGAVYARIEPAAMFTFRNVAR